MEEKEITTVVLENGLEYLIIDEILDNNNNYVYLTNVNDEEDFCIRKYIIENDNEIYVGLDNDDEFDQALQLYAKKNSN